MPSRPFRRRSSRLGAYGFAGALVLGSCGPTQCTPEPPPPPPPPPPPAAQVVPLEARPVQAPCQYSDTWGAARSQGRTHEGVDIRAAQGNEVYAVVTGVVSKIYAEAEYALAGNGLRIRQPDGTYFFYAHLLSVAPGIAVDTPVTAGQVVGYVGQTGNAGGPHLHLEIHPGGGAAINPYPSVAVIGAC